MLTRIAELPHWILPMPLPDNPTDAPQHDAYAALRFRDFRFLISASFLISFSQAVLSVIVGYELYLRTGSALALGLVGLVQIVPNVILSMPAGQFVDQHDHRLIASAAAGLIALAAAFLALLTHYEGPLILIYACLFLIGLGRVFNMATPAPLMASIVPPDRFHNAAAWRSSSNQTASILGPAAGGFGVAVLGSAASVFAIAAVLLAIGGDLAQPDQGEAESARAGEDVAGLDPGRDPLHPQHRGPAGHDHARHGRGHARRGDRVAADLCRGRAACRRGRVWD